MTEKLWKLTVFMTDGREKVIALYDDEGEALLTRFYLLRMTAFWDTRSNLSNMRLTKMKKYSLDVWLSGSKECFGLFDSEEVALEEGRILECSLGHPVKYAANPVQIVDEVEDMNPKDINGSFTAYYADSMDQSCPGEIHAKGFPADDPEAKREYEKAAKDFCIDNLSAFDK
nr:MAG: hypothetical protein [Bacteriophage sp.]